MPILRTSALEVATAAEAAVTVAAMAVAIALSGDGSGSDGGESAARPVCGGPPAPLALLSLGRVAVDHVSRANSSYGMRTRTRRPMHYQCIRRNAFAWQSIAGALASAGPKIEKNPFPAGN